MSPNRVTTSGKCRAGKGVGLGETKGRCCWGTGGAGRSEAGSGAGDIKEEEEEKM